MVVGHWLLQRFTEWKVDKELAIEAERQILLEQQEKRRVAQSVDKGQKLSAKKETDLIDRLYRCASTAHAFVRLRFVSTVCLRESCRICGAVLHDCSCCPPRDCK